MGSWRRYWFPRFYPGTTISVAVDSRDGLVGRLLLPNFLYVARRETGLPINARPLHRVCRAVRDPHLTQKPKSIWSTRFFTLRGGSGRSTCAVILGVVVLQLTYYLVRGAKVTMGNSLR